jgi:formate dehydrogenase maturation protein FdhE
MDATIQEELKEYFGRWLKEMAEWRSAHPKATLYEIEAYARTKRQELMAQVLAPVLEAVPPETAVCPTCGDALTRKGRFARQIETREAATQIEREYVYCPACKGGLFPPG